MAKISNENIPGEGPEATGEEFFLKDANLRDPFVLRVGKTYYLYAGLQREGVRCFTSTDLKKWRGPVYVFRTPKGFHGIKDFFWAPEVHYYRGRFYLFTSVFSEKTGHRTISVYRAESPLGPFEDIAGGCVGMAEWDCIDGTLFLDEEDRPWMVFVHEWVCMPDGNGAMCAVRLAEDLSRTISDPILLFYARDQRAARTGVTDGPFLYRTDKGRLLLTWSNYGKEDYFIALAASESGKISGPWRQEGLLYARGQDGARFDGGHGMIFQTSEGEYRMAFHAPNEPYGQERIVFRRVREEGDTIRLAPLED